MLDSENTPLGEGDILALGLAIANNQVVSFARLSKTDIRLVIRMAAAILARRRERGLTMPLARPSNLSDNQRKAILHEIGMTPGEIISGIFEEPLMQAVFAALGATVANLTVPPTPKMRRPR